MAARRSLTKDQKQQIIALAQQGYDGATVAAQLGFTTGRQTQQVTGYISTCRNSGVLPKLPKKASTSEVSMPLSPPPPLPEPIPGAASLPVPPPAAPQPGYYPQPAPGASPQNLPQDDFTGGRPIVGGSDGFSNTSQGIRYVIERTVPPDGLLGTHYGTFSRDKLGEIYGSGTYTIQRFEPGKPIPFEFHIKVSDSYGVPKFPNRTAENERPARAGYRFRRPWERHRDDEEEEDPRARQVRSYYGQHPYYNHPYYRHQQQAPQQAATPPDNSRAFSEFARQAASSDSTMAEMMRQMGTMHSNSLEQLQRARDGGPESVMTEFFQRQQDTMNQRFEEERHQAEDRRKAEEEKWERRQEADREAWNRRQDEERNRHDREVARMKTESETRLAEKEKEEDRRQKRDSDDMERRQKRETEERKFLLDLEDKRLKIVQEEARVQRERLEQERERLVAEVKDARESASEVIAESTEKLNERLKQREDQLEREHKLREKSLDTEQKLNEKILEIRKEATEKEGGDAFFGMIQSVVKELAKGFEKIAELKKMQSMSPEAHAAQISRGSIDGNVVGAPDAGLAGEPVPRAADVEPSPQATVRSESGNGNGNGNGHEERSGFSVEAQMEQVIQENIQTPLAKQILREWAVHVESGCDATTFANMYMDWMRDPKDDATRKACSGFANFMKPRKWDKMFAVLDGHLEPEVAAIFRMPEAAVFYEQFRSMVVEQIKDYWEQFLAAREEQRQKQQAAGQAPVAPSRQVEGTPVPATREGISGE